MKRIENIPDDLQTLFDFGIQSPSISNVDKMMSDIRESVLHSISETTRGPASLRMSNLGKPDRQLWYDIRRGRPDSGLDYSTRIKFLMGHIMEAVLLFLLKEAGHSVEDEQKTLDIDGVIGHQDAKIDGVITDVKTTSRFAFQKFSNAESLAKDDPFGYIGQISAYAQSQGHDRAAFLAINKESGEVAVCTVSQNQMIDARERIRHVKSVLDSDVPPSRCYDPVPEGASGNIGLPKMCSYCDHRSECWSDANAGRGPRGFRYANGVKYLLHVAREPNVPEIT
tara:strand:- start:3076 stop:3921 length:846 start_codon:yes stop_codon:yes gene_type:complete